MDDNDAVEMAYALYEIFLTSEEVGTVKTAAAPLFNTEAGRLFMKHNPVTL